MSEESATIGWREWVLLPDFGRDGAEVKAKVDTGARTSSLHAYDIEEVERDGDSWLRFRFHPIQRDEETVIEAEARLVDRRRVTASNGQSEIRYVVETDLQLDGQAFPIELTLTRRDAMGFRMLIGRRALRGRYLVDPRRSFRSVESKEHRKRIRARAGKRTKTRSKEAARP